MARRLLLFAAALFSCCASLGEGEASGKQRKIFASVGETAVLPCQTTLPWHDLLTVEWSKDKDKVKDKYPLLYRDGRESFQDKHPDFEFRTHLFMNELRKGNISLRISNVQLSDNGTFICKTILKRVVKVVQVELVVGAISEPKLSVVSAVDGELTLQCEANCWFQKPYISFIDCQGNNLNNQGPMMVEGSRGCFHGTRRVTLPTATNSVICKVHQFETNLTRLKDLQIYIPANCLKSCGPVVIALVAAAIIIIIGLVALIRLCRNSGRCKLASKIIRSLVPERPS